MPASILTLCTAGCFNQYWLQMGGTVFCVIYAVSLYCFNFFQHVLRQISMSFACPHAHISLLWQNFLVNSVKKIIFMPHGSSIKVPFIHPTFMSVTMTQTPNFYVVHFAFRLNNSWLAPVLLFRLNSLCFFSMSLYCIFRWCSPWTPYLKESLIRGDIKSGWLHRFWEDLCQIDAYLREERGFACVKKAIIVISHAINMNLKWFGTRWRSNACYFPTLSQCYTTFTEIPVQHHEVYCVPYIFLLDACCWWSRFKKKEHMFVSSFLRVVKKVSVPERERGRREEKIDFTDKITRSQLLQWPVTKIQTLKRRKCHTVQIISILKPKHR